MVQPLKRIYLPADLAAGTVILLPDSTFHHLFRVMRCRSEERLLAFNGDGYDYHGIIRQVSKKSAEFSVIDVVKNPRESSLYTILLQGLSKGDRMDTAIQKAVELGVNEIYPVRSEFSNTKLDGQRLIKKQQHWQAIIIAACEQSERAVIPVLHPLQSLDEAVANIHCPCKIMLHPYDADTAPQPLPQQTDRVALLIGPEGGFSDADLHTAEAADFQRLALGSRILRTETAAVSALSIVQYLWGDWRVI